MIQENPDRNVRIYEMWTNGSTIDEISFETDIPRSTVGYYVRKFNKCAKSGEPIVVQRIRKKPNEKVIAVQAWKKLDFFVYLEKMLKEEDGLDKAYKTLMIAKLMKELHRDIYPTEEERQAFWNNFPYMVEQIMRAKKVTST